MEIIKRIRCNNNYYIDKEGANAIKGFLMLLIVLGHNHLLAPSQGILFHYLYSFHLICFLSYPIFIIKSYLVHGLILNL